MIGLQNGEREGKPWDAEGRGRRKSELGNRNRTWYRDRGSWRIRHWSRWRLCHGHLNSIVSLRWRLRVSCLRISPRRIRISSTGTSPHEDRVINLGFFLGFLLRSDHPSIGLLSGRHAMLFEWFCIGLLLALHVYPLLSPTFFLGFESNTIQTQINKCFFFLITNVIDLFKFEIVHTITEQPKNKVLCISVIAKNFEIRKIYL